MQVEHLHHNPFLPKCVLTLPEQLQIHIQLHTQASSCARQPLDTLFVTLLVVRGQRGVCKECNIADLSNQSPVDDVCGAKAVAAGGKDCAHEARGTAV